MNQRSAWPAFLSAVIFASVSTIAAVANSTANTTAQTNADAHAPGAVGYWTGQWPNRVFHQLSKTSTPKDDTESGVFRARPTSGGATGFRTRDRNIGPTGPAHLIGGIQIFPKNCVFNADISNAPVSTQYSNWMANYSVAKLHPDFGSNPTYGIPVNVVSSTFTTSGFGPDGAWYSPIGSWQTFNFLYADECDPGPYPIPQVPYTEGASAPGQVGVGDAHLCIVDIDNHKLYEIGAYDKTSNAGAGAIWDLNSNKMRPDTWTSADAAGLPIAPLMPTLGEVNSGAINHAIRMTFNHTQSQMYLWPASHEAGVSGNQIPPIGMRLRLKASFSTSGFSPGAQAILAAMKKYGCIVADNGASGYFQGVSNPGWDDNVLSELKTITLTNFEIVNETGYANGGTPNYGSYQYGPYNAADNNPND
jgi:hypothetical protein